MTDARMNLVGGGKLGCRVADNFWGRKLMVQNMKYNKTRKNKKDTNKNSQAVSKNGGRCQRGCHFLTRVGIFFISTNKK